VDDNTWMVGANAKVILPPWEPVEAEATIYPWFFTSAGTLQYETNLRSPQLNNNRNLALYLPPSYNENYLKPYDQVLLMHDGNNVFSSACAGCCPFGCWNAHTTLNRMIVSGQINEVFVIAVYNTADRINEYTYSVDPGYGGGKGDLYLDFLEDTVLPYVRSRYRIQPKTGDVGVLGSSLGGLISCYAGWSRSAFYGRTGCMSSSFWWNNEDFNRTIIPKFQNPMSTTKLYIDVGGVNDGRAETETVRATFQRIGKPFDYYFDAGGSHSEGSWANRFDIPMASLYPLAFSPVALVPDKDDVIVN